MCKHYREATNQRIHWLKSMKLQRVAPHVHMQLLLVVLEKIHRPFLLFTNIRYVPHLLTVTAHYIDSPLIVLLQMCSIFAMYARRKLLFYVSTIVSSIVLALIILVEMLIFFIIILLLYGENSFCELVLSQ